MLLLILLTPLLLVARGVDRARQDALKAQCAGDLTVLSIALLQYAETYGTFPPGTVANPSLPPNRRLSWVTEVWNYVDSGAVLTIDPTKGWQEPPNWPIPFMAKTGTTFVGMTPADTMHFVICNKDPARSGRRPPFPLGYVGIAGLGPDAATLRAGHHRAGVFGYDRVTKLADIRDGTSRTMMLAETGVGHAPWSAGGPTSVRGVDPATRPYLGRGRPFGGYHPGGANVAMADGSVRFVRESVDPRVFEALATIAGGEALPAEWGR
jgi:prepilin-type processing-associated H-X9-DG protein